MSTKWMRIGLWILIIRSDFVQYHEAGIGGADNPDGGNKNVPWHRRRRTWRRYKPLNLNPKIWFKLAASIRKQPSQRAGLRFSELRDFLA